MSRLAVIVLCALAVAACGGSDPGASGGSEPKPAPAGQTPVVAGPSPNQLEFREELLQQLENGTYPPCGCTAELRAKDRIESGKVTAPDPDRLVSNLP